MSFPRYPKYKDSGLQWLDSIPEHWDIVRLKNVLECRITDGPHTTPEFIEEGIPFLSVDGIQGGELILEGCRYISHEAHNEYRKKAQPQKNDILMGKAASTGKIARVKTEAIFSIWSPLALIRIESRLSSPQFYEQVLKSAALQFQIDVLCTSNTQKNISMDDIPRLAMTKPPLEEQIAIATFLDRETAKIDALIAEQKRLIELLQEKRQAVISHAVTKGLNPNAPMKDSGVEWLGEVPVHWSVVEARREIDFLTSGSRGWAEFYSDNGYLFLRIGNLTRDSIDLALEDIQRVGPPDGAEGARTEVKEGDVLFSITAYLGSVAVVPAALERAYVSQHVCLARLNGKNLLPKWLAYTVLSTSGRAYLEAESYGGTKIQLSLDDIKSFPLAFPPLEEQKIIIERLQGSVAELKSLRSDCEANIALLQERRSALISAAVTGQIDVRGLVEEEGSE